MNKNVPKEGAGVLFIRIASIPSTSSRHSHSYHYYIEDVSECHLQKVCVCLILTVRRIRLI